MKNLFVSFHYNHKLYGGFGNTIIENLEDNEHIANHEDVDTIKSMLCDELLRKFEREYLPEDLVIVWFRWLPY